MFIRCPCCPAEELVPASEAENQTIKLKPDKVTFLRGLPTFYGNSKGGGVIHFYTKKKKQNKAKYPFCAIPQPPLMPLSCDSPMLP